MFFKSCRWCSKLANLNMLIFHLSVLKYWQNVPCISKVFFVMIFVNSSHLWSSRQSAMWCFCILVEDFYYLHYLIWATLKFASEELNIFICSMKEFYERPNYFWRIRLLVFQGTYIIVPAKSKVWPTKVTDIWTKNKVITCTKLRFALLCFCNIKSNMKSFKMYKLIYHYPLKYIHLFLIRLLLF